MGDFIVRNKYLFSEVVIMTETFGDSKWNTFETTGKVADYLQYKGINSKNFTDKTVQINTECKVQNEEIK
jgi:hypothetical protein